ncbi:unnamed protein product [Brassica napus]|uniref:(rape) hypothetical protein n=1 Tax=Brassica napus TaxID=3708 RepID=A0A816JYA6_BRANA|nr:unnamed protein product [Brassica napus]
MMGKRIASFKNLAKKAKSFKMREGSSEYVLIGEGRHFSDEEVYRDVCCLRWRRAREAAGAYELFEASSV